MTEYGRIHTDGSRSGGQPLQSDAERVARALAQADGIEICSDATYALSSYGHKAQAALAAMRQPTQSDCEVAASIRSALYRACSNMPNYPKGIVEPFVAAHHRHGYDQGYYDGLQADGAEERAKIVAWLRSEQISTEKLRDEMNRHTAGWRFADEHASALEQSAAAIERGEHMQEQSK